MNEIKPRETVNAMKLISDDFENLIRQIEHLKKQLELTEKRALEWERMHLDELEQRKELQKQLDGAQAAIRDQVERNMAKPEVVFADRMEKVSRDLAQEEWEARRKVEIDEIAKRDAYNTAARKHMEAQTQIMQENAHRDGERFRKHHELVERSVISSENQTMLMQNMSECLGNIVTILGVMSRRS